MPRANRSLRAQWLGTRLSRLRLAAGLTLTAAGDGIDRDPTSVSRFENGAAPIRSHLLLGLLDLYGVDDLDERTELLELCDDVASHGWWDAYKPYLSAEFADFLWVEERATAIREVSMVLVPGLLQTQQYASALIADDPALTEDLQVRRLTELRMARQRALTKATAPRLTAVLHEMVLRHPVGGNDVMREQLDQLTALVHQPGIDIRLLPMTRWVHGIGASAPGFEIYEMPKPYPIVAYTEHVSGLMCHYESIETTRMARLYDQLADQALDPQASASLIKAIAKET